MRQVKILLGGISMCLKQISDEKVWGHYGLNFILANDEATVITMIHLMEKRNRITKKIKITPMWRRTLKRELAARMKVRRERAARRRQHIYK